MALDFNVLTQVPTFGERFMAGRQAAQEEAQRNMLLQQRRMEFQQSQEDRRRKLEQESKFDQMADLIRENGLDPDDPKVLGQFAQAAMAARQPQLVSFVTSMAERAAQRRQALADAEAVRGAMREPGEEPVAPAAAAAMPVVTPATAAVTPPAVVAAAPTALPEPTLDERGVNRAAWMAKAGLEEDVAPAPVNALAPVSAAAPVNAMVAPAARLPQTAAPAARPAAPDVTRMEEELERLQTRYDRVAALGTEAARKQAALLKPEIDRLSRRIERASKATERESPLMRDVVAFGFEPTADGLAKFEAAKRDPDTVGTKEYNLAVRQGFKGSLLDYKKELAEAGRTKVDIGVQAFEPANIQAQKDFISAASRQRETLANAPSIIDNVNAARQLIPGASAFMGTGGEPLLNVASFLNNRLGFSINTRGVTDATELRTRLFESILENLKKLDSQPTQQQQNALRDALGSLGTDPAALPRILDRIEDSVRDRVERYNKDVTSAEQRGVRFPLEPTIALPPRVRPAAIPTTPAAAPAAAPAATPAAAQPIYARNPTTNERIMSTDGGRTWSPAR